MLPCVPPWYAAVRAAVVCRRACCRGMLPCVLPCMPSCVPHLHAAVRAAVHASYMPVCSLIAPSHVHQWSLVVETRDLGTQIVQLVAFLVQKMAEAERGDRAQGTNTPWLLSIALATPRTNFLGPQLSGASSDWIARKIFEERR